MTLSTLLANLGTITTLDTFILVRVNRDIFLGLCAA